MNMAKPKLLLLGATGYIAGVLLSHWHEHGFQMLPFDVTVSGRSRERLALLEKLLGISTVALSFENLALLEEEVQKYDIVVQLADCDAMAATHTILRGMKARYDSTRTPPLLFHASGAAFLDVYTGGQGGLDCDVLADVDVQAISEIPISLPHRNVDLAIIAADKAGYLRSYIVIPFAVFGTALGIMHESGIANPSSMPIPRLIEICKDYNFVPQLGSGRNQKAWVHVEDVASLFDKLILCQPTHHGHEGIFFCNSGEIETSRIMAALADAFYTAGIFEHAHPKAMLESVFETAPLRYWASTERGRADRSRLLGWQPRHDLSGLLQHVKDEVSRLCTGSVSR